jgi:exopolyphosphatase/guanosine-5'-triphosphate,3'-diphosphate pyrophosphatase
MFAAIDIGSNTLRMLLGTCEGEGVHVQQYLRKIVRLSGDFCPQNGLHQDSMQRAFNALKGFSDAAGRAQVTAIRVVATEAVRRASNRDHFVDRVKRETGLTVEVIDGDREAELTSSGVLSVIDPLPDKAIIMDIGGGSTELICLGSGRTLFQKSYPLGVVRLCEEAEGDDQRQTIISDVFADFRSQLEDLNLYANDYCLIGTAGTVTTLAAMHLKLNDYNPTLINNHRLPLSWLKTILADLLPMSYSEREEVVGMEQGRGDLIPHGINIVLALCQTMQQEQLKVSDSGLLEGLLKEMCRFR